MRHFLTSTLKMQCVNVANMQLISSFTQQHWYMHFNTHDRVTERNLFKPLRKITGR